MLTCHPAHAAEAAGDAVISYDRPMHVVFDVDGTLSDDRHRRHLAPTHDGADHVPNADWGPYLEDEHRDPCHEFLSRIMRCLKDTHTVRIVTGRTESRREKLHKWLRIYGIDLPRARIHMRPEPHAMTPVAFKHKITESLMNLKDPVDLAFDDDGKALKMYESFGVAAVDAKQFWRPQE